MSPTQEAPLEATAGGPAGAPRPHAPGGGGRYWAGGDGGGGGGGGGDQHPLSELPGQPKRVFYSSMSLQNNMISEN